MMQALRGHGAPLLSIVPDDIDTWCPAYRPAGDNQRAAFCAGMVSSLAWHESTHREAAVGGSSLWFGLVQIAPSTARLYQCNARSDQAPLDGAFNLRCRLRIMASTVSRGMAADWGRFIAAQSARTCVTGSMRRFLPDPGSAHAAPKSDLSRRLWSRPKDQINA
jgi:hypothetical protein